MVLLLLAACALPYELRGADNAAACGTTGAFLYGTVTDPDGEPAEDALVWAWTDGDETVEAELGGDGSYELNLPRGAVWTVQAEAGGCASEPVTAALETCSELELELTITDCG